MRIAREHQYNEKNPPWLHCVSRCVRCAFLCGDGFEHRKLWIEQRLELLVEVFSVKIAAYAIMSNHLHVVIRPDVEGLEQVSDEEIALRWLRMKYAPLATLFRGAKKKKVQKKSLYEVLHKAPSENELRQHAQVLVAKPEWIAEWRQRFASASWFMKALKEPIARAANKEDKCTGAFWEGRFSSQPLLDEASVLAAMAYVDLNPIRGVLAQDLSSSEFTSIKKRLDQRSARVKAAKLAVKDPKKAKEILEEKGLRLKRGYKLEHLQKDSDHQCRPSLLTPISDIFPKGSLFSLNSDRYFQLVDYTGRCVRGDKQGAISTENARILHALQYEEENWLACMSQSQGMTGAVLGHITARAQELKRRTQSLLKSAYKPKWFQVRCELFKPKQV